ncbi:uncharacterized protein KD926_010140 [Aspergillus affinis]|uniref:uncharacterized protein n=1 Tax=Aspergillus affinis TaxID=1070780 RepID=UPI0022FE072E|nr:uncharacterized protein KD926_010140 [Aspergillus affinis]KAI9038926.1 hypothetical protein KD926_010140 [Aspergillus affinis]
MFDFDFLAELPADTPRMVASTLNSIKSAIRRNLQHPYIVIDYVNPDIVERLVESPRLRFLKASRLFYDADLRKLILKIPSTFHDAASRAFDHLLTRHMESSGVDEEVAEPQGSGRVKDGPYSKEPDESYLPVRRIPGRDPKWPTLVVEVGYSETRGRLRVDCRWWLGRSQGQVKIALLLSIDRDRPHILIEKWENGPATHGYNFRVPGRLSPQKTAAISVTLENDDATKYMAMKALFSAGWSVGWVPAMDAGKGTAFSLTNMGNTALKSEKFTPSGPTFWVTHSDRKNHPLLLRLGATRCFDYKSPHVTSDIQSVLEQEGSGPVLQGFDTVGSQAGLGSTQSMAACVSPDATFVSVVVQQGPRFRMPLATSNSDVKIQLKGVLHPITIPARKADYERAWMAFQCAVTHCGSRFQFPSVEIFNGSAEEAMDQVLAVSGHGRGLGKCQRTPVGSESPRRADGGTPHGTDPHGDPRIFRLLIAQVKGAHPGRGPSPDPESRDDVWNLDSTGTLLQGTDSFTNQKTLMMVATGPTDGPDPNGHVEIAPGPSNVGVTESQDTDPASASMLDSLSGDGHDMLSQHHVEMPTIALSMRATNEADPWPLDITAPDGPEPNQGAQNTPFANVGDHAIDLFPLTSQQDINEQSGTSQSAETTIDQACSSLSNADSSSSNCNLVANQTRSASKKCSCIRFPERLPEDDEVVAAEDFGHTAKIPETTYELLLGFWRTQQCVQCKATCQDTSFISQALLNAMIQLYHEHFDPWMPFLHPSVFEDGNVPWILVLAVASVGCQHSDITNSEVYLLGLRGLLQRALNTTVYY